MSYLKCTKIIDGGLRDIAIRKTLQLGHRVYDFLHVIQFLIDIFEVYRLVVNPSAFVFALPVTL